MIIEIDGKELHVDGGFVVSAEYPHQDKLAWTEDMLCDWCVKNNKNYLYRSE